MTESALTSEQRQQMEEYLLQGRFYNTDELAQMSGSELRKQYIDMNKQISEMEEVNGDAYENAEVLRASLRD